MDYKAGKFVGVTCNNRSVSITAFVFMQVAVNSIFKKKVAHDSLLSSIIMNYNVDVLGLLLQNLRFSVIAYSVLLLTIMYSIVSELTNLFTKTFN